MVYLLKMVIFHGKLWVITRFFHSYIVGCLPRVDPSSTSSNHQLSHRKKDAVGLHNEHTIVFHGVFVDPSSQQGELWHDSGSIFSDLIQYPQQSEMGNQFIPFIPISHFLKSDFYIDHFFESIWAIKTIHTFVCFTNRMSNSKNDTQSY